MKYKTATNVFFFIILIGVIVEYAYYKDVNDAFYLLCIYVALKTMLNIEKK